MGANGCLLLRDRDRWQLIDDSYPDVHEAVFFPSNEAASQAEAIANQLQERGLAKSPLVVGLATSACLSVSIPVDSPQLLRKRTSMRYHLEEWIPWSAEDYVVDFISQSQTAFVVAVEIEPLKSLIQGLEDLGISVVSICPSVLLALSEYLLDGGKKFSDRSSIFWRVNDRVEYLTLAKQQIVTWSSCKYSAEEILRELRFGRHATEEENDLWLINFDPQVTVELQDAKVPVHAESERDFLEQAFLYTQRIVAGTHEAPLELQRDELAATRSTTRLRRELSRVYWAAIILLICASAGFWIRSTHYEDKLIDARAELEEVYQRVFSGKSATPSTDVAAEINREYQQLQATRGGSRDLPASVDAVSVLQRVLTAMPDSRLRLPEIQIDRDRLSLASEVRSNSDADRIANAMREHGFVVDSPKTQRLADKGVSMRLSGKLNAKPTGKSVSKKR